MRGLIQGAVLIFHCGESSHRYSVRNRPPSNKGFATKRIESFQSISSDALNVLVH